MSSKWKSFVDLRYILGPNSKFLHEVNRPHIILTPTLLSLKALSTGLNKIRPRITNILPPKNVTPIDINYDVEEHTAEQSLRSIKYSLIALGISLTFIGSYLIVEYGKPPVDEDGNPMEDQYTSLPKGIQEICRGLSQIKNFAVFLQEPSREKLLPDVVKYPYHQPPYTLVLELTDILVHPDWTYYTGWRFKKRPGIDYLLENLSGLYEIVIFTAEQGMTVFPIIEALDEKNLISYKLVRDATHFVDGHHVKNLDKLNRDLNKVIVVDWNPDSVKFHQDNMLNIGRWKGNDNDTALIDLTALLTTIAQNEISDVRDVLKYYQQFDNPLATFRQKQREWYQMQDGKAKAKATK